MGARKGISDGKCSPWCAIKEKLDALWNKTQNAYTHINGYDADGSQNLRINGSEGVIVETISGNEIRLVGAAAEPYTAQSPIVIDPETKTVSINMDAAPISGSGNAVSSGGVYAADQALQEAISDVGSDLSTETASRIAGIQNLHNDIQTEQSARLQDVAALTRQISTEETRRQNADTALGGRIDSVINGTTPPATISGVLPIQNGGTGSSTQNWVGLTGDQEIDGQKMFKATGHNDYVTKFKGNSALNDTQTEHTITNIGLFDSNGVLTAQWETRVFTDGQARSTLNQFASVNPNNFQSLIIQYSSDNTFYLIMQKITSGVSTNTVIGSL